MKALLDLFARYRNRETGVWTLGQDPQRTIYLEGGQLAFAQSTHPLDKLTTLLVERGKLTQAQLDYALQNLKPGLSVGRNLIEMGFITQRDLLEMAKAQVERVVWGAMGNLDEEPRFQPKELDDSVVRLGMDTPLTLLVGCLHLRDRERLLELLGPLEQKLQLIANLELNLPPDLAKVPALLDGQRRLLDLAQEAGVEPMRLGAFALFLREMGLARLNFGPPPVEVEPPPILLTPASALLAEPASPLLASIEAAQRPTVDLNHLAGSLDAMDEAEPLDAAAELPPAAPESFPDLRIKAEASGSVDLPPSPEITRPSSRKGLWIVILLVVGSGGGYAGWRWSQAQAKPTPVTGPIVPPKPESEVLVPAPKPIAQPSPAAPKPVEPKPEPAPAAPVAAETTQESRWKTLQKGDWELALSQGSAHRSALKGAWVLRLEVACQPETLAHAVAAFKTPADLFLVPMAMKDGRTCRQVCLGGFSSEADAQAGIAKLPAFFTEGGNKPKPFQASALPEKQ